ncbi:beta-glucosidase BglX [Parvularcula sp. LCG005]|uniref:beta-glucosidase BglX n=1 Tax=Parvularcula sp. LCG005 TaxID=3078805 RepID=UPI00294295EB|nr:beta-glucosidase BglX [Parvularcula sp. LCG005]WOI52418.1 beta-glucosidase BglX [Parvularcula sp. LCG005]
MAKISPTSLRAFFIMGAASLAIGSAGCFAGAIAQETAPAAEETAAQTTIAAEATAQGLRGGERVDYILSRMTLEEKLGQLHQMPGGRSKNLNSRLNDDEFDRVRQGQVGSYLHVAGAEALRPLQEIAVTESRHGIPLLFAMDVVHGYRTIFPVPLAMAASFDEEAAELAAHVAATEAAAAALHWTFAPMIDIARDPRWGRVVEGGGEEPYLGARMAVAQVKGFQGDDLTASDTIVATAKHFGAYGAGIGGRDYNSADVSMRTLKEVYFPPFYAAAEAGAGSFMVAFNDIAGVPTTGNKALVHDLLRTVWGYQGLVVSDWNSILELIAHGVAADRADAGALALAASVDMEMTSGIYVADMVDKVKGSEALQKSLDQSVRRILMTKESLGLFDDPLAYHDAEREAAVMLSDDHRAAARDVARSSFVLLKNDGTLPLSKDVGSVAVIGSLADDEWSPLGSWRGQGKTDDVVTVLDGIKAALPEGVVTYEPGAPFREDADPKAIREAVKAAKKADAVILVIGEDYDLSGEARSRSSIDLPAPQAALADAVLATGKPVVVVLMNGRPLNLSPINDQSAAILETWLGGIEMGHAVADVLFGEVSPGGKLPMTFPRTTGQVPIYMAHNSTGRPADPDLSKDTARYLDLPITPLYPFGHGLSYSSFTMSDMRQSSETLGAGETLDITITVSNDGDRTADEVVQLYVRDSLASVARPVQELRGFKRMTLDAGQSAEVTFSLTPGQFAFIDQSGDWIVEAGDIQFMLGSSSADIHAKGTFTLGDGISATAPAAAIATPVTVKMLP